MTFSRVGFQPTKKPRRGAKRWDTVWKYSLVLLFVGCQTTANIKPSTDVLKAVLEAEPLSTNARQIVNASLKDFDRQITALADEYEKLLNEYRALEKEHTDLQDRYSDSQRDAGVKDTLVMGFWALVTVFCGYVIYKILQKKITI